MGFDTKLTPLEESRYRLAAAKAGRSGDSKDYDLRGAWNKDAASIGSKGHLTDEFKKPNHPSFSTDSMYSSASNPGGSWVAGAKDSWSFTPSKRQISRAGGLAPFKKAFGSSERGQNSGLVIPPSY